MVELKTVLQDNAALVQQPLVAVFFGGTSGIGHYTLRALAKQSAENNGKGFRAYIVGRNSKAAGEITRECKGIFPETNITFVKAEDLSLIREADKACAEISQLEAKHGNDARIDYLMVSYAGMPYLPRNDTEEGLDKTMSLMYYSRMRVIGNLQPLLLKSPSSATVVSVFAGGMEDKLLEDLSLRNLKEYNYNQARSHIVYMHTAYLEKIAEQNPGKISLLHIYPGLVAGPAFNNPDLPGWFRFLWHWIFIPLFSRWVTVPADETGNRMLSLASSRYPPPGEMREGAVAATDERGGSYSLTWNGDSNYNKKAYQTVDKAAFRQKVWQHTNKAFELITTNGVFKD